MARPRKTSVTDSALLEAALEGLEMQKNRIEQQMAEVRRLLGKRPARKAADGAAAEAEPKQKRELSAEARKRIAAAQKKRWAAFRKGSAAS